MSYSVSLTVGRLQSGEQDLLWTPRPVTPAKKYGIVMWHGAGTEDMGVASPGWPDLARMASRLANEGWPIISPCQGIDHFANSTAMSRIDSAISYLGSNFNVSATKAHLLGVSMGGGTVARYAGLNRNKVQSVNALIPMANIYSLFKGELAAGPQSGIDLTPGVGAAWGSTSRSITINVTSGSSTVTSANANFTSADVNGAIDFSGNTSFGIQGVINSTTATANFPLGLSGTYSVQLWSPLPTGNTATSPDISAICSGASSQVPGRLFYAGNDTLIKPSDVTALGASSGWPAIQVSASGGHANPTALAWRTYNNGIEFQNLVDFLNNSEN